MPPFLSKCTSGRLVPASILVAPTHIWVGRTCMLAKRIKKPYVPFYPDYLRKTRHSQMTLACQVAIALWQLLLPDKFKLLDDFVTFLTVFPPFVYYFSAHFIHYKASSLPTTRRNRSPKTRGILSLTLRKRCKPISATLTLMVFRFILI